MFNSLAICDLTNREGKGGIYSYDGKSVDQLIVKRVSSESQQVQFI